MRETPKLMNTAIDRTRSLLRVGAASVQIIQIRGDMTPEDSCQRNRKATEAAPDVWVDGDTAVLMLAMTSIKTAFAAVL